jgi:hypothetical protein
MLFFVRTVGEVLERLDGMIYLVRSVHNDRLANISDRRDQRRRMAA